MRRKLGSGRVCVGGCSAEYARPHRPAFRTDREQRADRVSLVVLPDTFRGCTHGEGLGAPACVSTHLRTVSRSASTSNGFSTVAKTLDASNFFSSWIAAVRMMTQERATS